MEVKGNCPMGCGTTLFLGSGGYITCSWEKCPNPGAASDLLKEGFDFYIPTLVDRLGKLLRSR